MSKLTKEDFDNYLGTEAFFKEEDKRRFRRKIHPPKGLKKHWIPQLLTLALVMGLFIAGVQFFLGESSIPLADNDTDTDQDTEQSTEWSNWIKANSLEDVEDFYETTIPGLKIAKELNQVIAVNQSYTLEDGTTISIDKAWYHEDKLYLFYSMDLSDIEVTDDQKIGKLYRLDLKVDTKKTWFLDIDSSSNWNGVVFQNPYMNKIYREATITLDEVSQFLGKEQITFSLSNNDERIYGNLSEITLPVSYGSEVISSNEMKETIQTKNSKITLDRFDYGAGKGYLFGSIDSKLGQEIEFVNGTLTFHNGEQLDLTERIKHLNDGGFVMEVPELTTENISMNLQYLSMIDNKDTIDISLDLSEYDPDNKKAITMNKKVDTIGNTDIFVRAVNFEDQGVSVGFSAKKIDKSNPAQIQLVSIIPETGDQYDEIFPNILRAVDNNGEKASGHQLYSPGNEIDTDIYSFGISKSFIEGKDKINATIGRLSFGEKMDWTVEIPKQN